MRGLVVGLVVVGACRARPPEPLSTEALVERDEPVAELTRPPDPVLAPRPELDIAHLVADPTHELRWPLPHASHPELAPQFEIAAALAEPGVDWIELCHMGAHNRRLGKDRRDHTTYLRGWCSVGTQDFDAALAHLVPLTSSVVLGLAPAVRADFANILVSSGDANDASRLLARHRITDVGVIDTLAATYVEIGRLDDAYAINELALAYDDRRNHANRCRRLNRRFVLRPPPRHLRAVDLPGAGLFDVPAGADETCTRLERELECWLDPVAGCKAHFVALKLDASRVAQFVAAYSSWPTTGAGDWWGIARSAYRAMPHPGADRLVVTALANELRTTRCTSPHLAKIAKFAQLILDHRDHDPALEPELAQLIDDQARLCLARP